MVNSQKTEDMSGGGTIPAGIPGTPSTLPPPAPRPPLATRGTVSRRTENISYQSSHTVRHVREPQGTIKRMSVSLLVDSNVRYEGTGAKAKRIVEAPSADKLKAIHDLVAGVIGLSTERGDQLVVETLPFESTLNPEQLPPPKPPPAPPLTWQEQFLKNRIFVIAVGAGAALLLALLFLALRLAAEESEPAGHVARRATRRSLARRTPDANGETYRRSGGATRTTGDRGAEFFNTATGLPRRPRC